MSKQFYILNLVFWSLAIGLLFTQTYLYHQIGGPTPVIFMNGLSIGMITVLLVVYSILLHKKVKEERLEALSKSAAEVGAFTQKSADNMCKGFENMGKEERQCRKT